MKTGLRMRPHDVYQHNLNIKYTDGINTQLVEQITRRMYGRFCVHLYYYSSVRVNNALLLSLDGLYWVNFSLGDSAQLSVLCLRLAHF